MGEEAEEVLLPVVSSTLSPPRSADSLLLEPFWGFTPTLSPSFLSGDSTAGALAHSAPPVKIKVLLLGPTGAGKTALINRFMHESFDESTQPTIGADLLQKQMLLDGRRVLIEAWDTAGQERFRSLSSSFYRGADACFLVYDSSSEESFLSLSSWLEEFCVMSGLTVGSPAFLDFPIYVLANKCDLPLLDSSTRVLQLKAKKWCRDHGNLPLFNVSAMTAECVEHAFLFGVERGIARKISLVESVYIPGHVIERRDISKSSRPRKSTGCC